MLFRCDASLLMGTGHLNRCLELARRLNVYGCSVEFACRELYGNQNQNILASKFQLQKLEPPRSNLSYPTTGYEQWLEVPIEQEISEMKSVFAAVKPDIVIFDHYALSSRWCCEVYDNNVFTVAIDDLADRELEVDLIVNQNLGDAANISSYAGLCKPSTEFLMGPEYAILGPNSQHIGKVAYRGDVMVCCGR